MSVNATTSYQSYLMKGTESSGTVTYTKLVDVKDIPALGGAPERVETTTLTEPMRTYVAGIQDTEDIQFTANYNPTDYATLVALANAENYYAVWFDDGTATYDTPTGNNGKFSFQGQLSVYVDAMDVNAVRDMIITITPSTVITFSAS